MMSLSNFQDLVVLYLAIAKTKLLIW